MSDLFNLPGRFDSSFPASRAEPRLRRFCRAVEPTLSRFFRKASAACRGGFSGQMQDTPQARLQIPGASGLVQVLAAFAALSGAKRSSVCVDITDLLAYAGAYNTVSGIQRVIIKVISGFIDMYGVDSVDLIHLDKGQRVFFRTSAEFFSGDYAYDQDAFCAYFKLKKAPGEGASLRDYVHMRYANRPIKRHFNYLRLLLANKFDNGRSFSRRNIAERATALPEEKVVWRAADFGKHDRVVILGALWDFPGYGAALARHKACAGFTVYQMVHDLIPLVTPEHVGASAPVRFEKYMDDVFQAADVILANSKTTAKDVERYAEAKSMALPPVAVVPLAHEFIPGAAEPVARRPLRLFNGRHYRLPEYLTARVSGAVIDPYVLAIGTIESRKNILRLIRVWTEIFRKNPFETPTLILAGRPGFRSKEIFATLDAIGYLGGKIVVLDRPDDGEVAFLYANCLFSICISYYEGWGLPVGESLWFGRPALASRTSSLPEVGGDLVDYCDPYNDREIEAKLSHLIFDEKYRNERAEAIEQASLRTWKHVLLDLWDALHNWPEAPDWRVCGGGDMQLSSLPTKPDPANPDAMATGAAGVRQPVFALRRRHAGSGSFRMEATMKARLARAVLALLPVAFTLAGCAQTLVNFDFLSAWSALLALLRFFEMAVTLAMIALGLPWLIWTSVRETIKRRSRKAKEMARDSFIGPRLPTPGSD